MLESKIANALENNNFATSFMLLRVWSEYKEDYMEVRKKVRRGLDYRIVNKVMCFLESSYSLYQKCVNLDAQE